jgi:uncharacterized protein YdeI (YjbR/CyaY-like superfamily)
MAGLAPPASAGGRAARSWSVSATTRPRPSPDVAMTPGGASVNHVTRPAKATSAPTAQASRDASDGRAVIERSMPPRSRASISAMSATRKDPVNVAPGGAEPDARAVAVDVGPGGRPRVHAETRDAWRLWLLEHADGHPGVWLVSWKVGTGRPRIAYEDAVAEALCVGWIDSRPGTIDDERSMLWFTPRKRGSAWSRLNKERVGRLEAAGLMTDAGRAVVAAARADGSWDRLDDVERHHVPDDLAPALAARPGARASWDGFPPSERRRILEWIAQAKREETRRKRVNETAEAAARGERANLWRPH